MKTGWKNGAQSRRKAGLTVKPALRYAAAKSADFCGFWRFESERVGKNASFHPNSLAVCRKTFAHPNARIGSGAV